MKTKFFYLLITSFLLIVLGCQDKHKSQDKQIKVTDSISTSQNSKNSMAWQGTYFGELPCASCPGINTLITLYADSTFEKVVEYKEEKDALFTTKGTIVWKENNTKFALEDALYEIDGDIIFCLDKEGKKIEGELAENFILQRTELEQSPDINDGYNLVIFLGSDNKTYNIIFNDNPEVPLALIDAKDFQKTLIQKDAWKKGAEYFGNDVKLVVEEKKATLTIKDLKIDLKKQ